MLHAVNNFEVEVYILTQHEGGRHTVFKSGYSPQFFINNIAITGSVKIPSDVDCVYPGDRTTLEVQDECILRLLIKCLDLLHPMT